MNPEPIAIASADISHPAAYLSTVERPLITFVLLAYNQERYIREAVEGALAQTYSPLEIILSDDCSKDRTFAVMEAMAAAYTGPHRIILNRNAINLGLGAHCNKLFEMATGELIVMAAGDDVSLPERTAHMAAFWRASACPHGSLFSNMEVIDENGASSGLHFTQFMDSGSPYPNTIEGMIRLHKPGIAGCSHVMHRDVYRLFGPLNADVVAEDATLGFRAAALGGIQFLNTPLVKYRRHANAITGKNTALMSQAQLSAERVRLLKFNASILRQWERDLQHPIMRQRFSTGDRQQWTSLFRRMAKIAEVKALVSKPYSSAGLHALFNCICKRPRLPWTAAQGLAIWLGCYQVYVSLGIRCLLRYFR